MEGMAVTVKNGGYRDQFPQLMEEMAVTMKNGGHIDKWRLPCKMAVTVTNSID